MMKECVEVVSFGACADRSNRYWTRLTSVNGMSSSTQRRFREHFTKYVKSMYPEALARDHHEYLSIADYMAARRDSVGGMTLLDNALIHSDLPDEVFEHPHIRKMLDYTIDIIIFTNVRLLPFMFSSYR